MRNALLMSAGLLCLAAVPALAQMSQSPTITTQTPPSPNAQSFTPSPGVSVPAGAATGVVPRSGDNVGTTQTSPGAAPMMRQPGAAPMATAPMGTAPMEGTDRGMTGMRPMRGQQQHSQGMHHGEMHHGQGMPHRGAAQSSRMRGPAQATGDGAYDGSGGSVPTSTRASNINRGDTRTEYAPRLPNPDAAGSTPEAYLAAADRALAARQTGRAQEALERAETRLLTRSTDPSMANSPDNAPVVQQIAQARQALARGDMAGARQAIRAAQAGAGTMGMQGGPMGTGMDQGMMPGAGTAGPGMVR